MLGALLLLLVGWQVCWALPVLSYPDKKVLRVLALEVTPPELAVSWLPRSGLLLDSFLPYIRTHPEQLFATCAVGKGTER